MIPGLGLGRPQRSLPLPVQFYMVNPNLNEQSREQLLGRKRSTAGSSPYGISWVSILLVSISSLPTAFLQQNFLREDCPSANRRKHLLSPHLLMYSDGLFFLKDRSCASLQTRSALLVSLKTPCRTSSVSGEGLVSSGHAGAVSPGGTQLTRLGGVPERSHFTRNRS